MKSGLVPGLALAATLLGCGTDAGKPNTRTTPSEAEPVHFSGSINDEQTGDPIADAVVEVQVGDQIFSDRTDASGRFDLSIGVDRKSLPDWTALAAFVDDDTYLPDSVFYRDLEPGAASTDVDIRLLPAYAADIVLQRSLIHLGDDRFSGAINSQLQAPTSGTSLAVEFVLDADRLAHGVWLTVGMELRGAQCPGANGNLAYVGRIGEIPPDGDPRLLSLGMSNDDGSFAPVTFTWDLSAYAAGDRLEFVVLSTDGCNNIGNWDDFELLEIVGKFHA